PIRFNPATSLSLLVQAAGSVRGLPPSALSRLFVSSRLRCVLATYLNRTGRVVSAVRILEIALPLRAFGIPAEFTSRAIDRNTGENDVKPADTWTTVPGRPGNFDGMVANECSTSRRDRRRRYDLRTIRARARGRHPD